MHINDLNLLRKLLVIAQYEAEDTNKEEGRIFGSAKDLVDRKLSELERI